MSVDLEGNEPENLDSISFLVKAQTEEISFKKT